MADNNFRGFRSRDPIARDDVDPTAGDLADNPLADLARLIGQRDRNDFDRGGHHDGAVQTLEHQAPAESQDWAADERYAEPNVPQQYADEDYAEPRLPEYSSDPAYAEDEREPAPAARYAEPAEQYDDPHDEGAYERRYRGEGSSHDAQYRDDERSYAPATAPRYREEAAPQSRAVARQAPALAPQATHEEEEYDDEQWDEHGYDQSDIPDEYAEETGTTRRSGLAIVLALLGLVLIGAAGAYAYRAMFGGAIMTPSLPPIIKPAVGPNKIVPAPLANSSNQAGINPAAPAQLVPREEQPVPVQPPPAPPKVLSQIPVPQAPSAPPAVTPAPEMNAPPPAAPVAPKASAQPQAAPTPGEPKRVHTIAIPSDQVGNNANAAPPPTAPTARPRAAEPVIRPAPAPRGGANAPLSLVPGAQNSAPASEPPPRTRSARTEPPARAEAPSAPVATAPSAGGGYAVQVTSQRSEAEAQTAFRELQGKFPSQLAGHQPMIRRADLGEKGTYYRAMVGPFGSAEAAASLCSSLKAAGGSCIVQKN